jgi:hypothetical protein
MRDGSGVHGRHDATPAVLERRAWPSRRSQVLAALAALAAALGIYAGVHALASHSDAVSAAPGRPSASAHRFRAQALLGAPSAAAAQAAAAIGASDPAYRVSRAGEGLRAYSPAQRVESRFTAAGVAISSGATHVTLRPAGIGYGSILRSLPAVAPTAHENRVRYALPGVSEWFANGPLGIEQGFTVARAPAFTGASGPLTLSLSLAGGAHARMQAGGVALAHSGGAPLRYGDLSATDATGRALRSWIELHGSRLLLRIDATGARFPLRIDPYIQQAELTNGPFFGSSVALSADGNTALIGDRSGGEHVKGADYVFTRSGTTWTQQAVLAPEQSCGRAGALSANGDVALLGCKKRILLFTRSGSSWHEEGTGLPETKIEEEAFALSGDGNTALVGDREGSGSVTAYRRSGGTWTPEGAPLTVAGAKGIFGLRIAISGDGNTALIAGAANETSWNVWTFVRSGETWTAQGEPLAIARTSTGVALALDESGDTALLTGNHTFAYGRTGESWTQQAEFAIGGSFASASLSADGNTALVGEPSYKSFDGTAEMFTRTGSTWKRLEFLFHFAKVHKGFFGEATALSASGKTALVGESNNGFGVVYRDAPEVTKVAPGHGLTAGGATVELTGANFTGATSVDFGGTEATSFTVNSDGSITATAPPGTGTVDVTVNNIEGPGRSVAGDKFTYGPLVTGVSPVEGPTTGGTEVVITGAQFGGATAVHFGATNAAFTVESEETIRAFAPAGSAGTADVTVTTSEGTSPAVAGDHFLYVAPPTVTKVKPNKGAVAGGGSVTITGTGFRHVSSVSFGATPAAGYTVVSETSITATAPAVANVGKVNVTVTAVGGTSAPAASNAYTFTPQITGLSPNAGSVAGGTHITVTGDGLAPGTKGTVFKFGTARATSVNCTSTTECTVVAPAHAAGTVDVLATANKETSLKEAADKYTYS